MIEKEEEMNNVDEALFPKSSFILKTHVRGYNFEERQAKYEITLKPEDSNYLEHKCFNYP